MEASKEIQAERWAGISQALAAARSAMATATALARALGEDAVADQFSDTQVQISEWRDNAREQRRAVEGIK